MSSHPYILGLKKTRPYRFVGRVRKVFPGYIEAVGPLCTVGDICTIERRETSSEDGNHDMLAEVAAIEGERIVLIPLEPTQTIYPDAKVVVLPRSNQAVVGGAFAGRLVDALARPLDGGAEIFSEHVLPISGQVLQPLEREDPRVALQTGVRALDGLLTIGRGQRVGIFAASGVGKTTLLGQLGRQLNVERCVFCMVGERGREVEAFWRHVSSDEQVKKFSCVAATSDMSAVLRVRAVYQALCLAEYWRDQGEHVVLLIDSITRFAMALREIGLASGAPPTLRAYTPNVFEALPRVVERCGAAKSGGSITAIMTILSETDEVDDPIVEVMKSLLDGHFVLSRQIAEKGRFPAIDVTKSISRQSEDLVTPVHTKTARNIVAMLSTYEDAKIMIESDIYKKGSNVSIDEAIAKRAEVIAFLKQGHNENVPFSETLESLMQISEVNK